MTEFVVSMRPGLTLTLVALALAVLLGLALWFDDARAKRRAQRKAADRQFNRLVGAGVDVIGVVARAPNHRVIARAARQLVIAGAAEQAVIAVQTRQDVVARIALRLYLHPHLEVLLEQVLLVALRHRARLAIHCQLQILLLLQLLKC